MSNLSLAKSLVNRRHQEQKQSPNWFAYSFPEQTAFIEDPARLKVGFCTRRAGKSYGCGLYLCKEAYENPGVSVVYIAKTRESAKKIIWKDVLKTINRVFKLNAHFSEQELVMTLNNGSQIYVGGADGTKDEMDKLLGQKFKLVVLDEASKFRIASVKKLIFDILRPATVDYEGTIVMIGTADNYINSYFARVTSGREYGWNLHTWSALDNPHTSKSFQADMDELINDNPDVVKEPWFRQNYLKEWVVDDNVRVFKYPKDSILDALPRSGLVKSLGITPNYALGVTAFSIVGYTSMSKYSYVFEAYSIPSTDILSVVLEIRKHQEDVNSITLTNASKRLTKEMRSRFGVSVVNAEDKDKPALLKLFTSDLSHNSIKVLASNTDLIDEWDSVIRDEDKDDLVIDSACPDPISTATLFAWQYCYNFDYSVKPTSDDPMDEYWDNLGETLEEDFHEDSDPYGY
jgi:hypothetical protein